MVERKIPRKRNFPFLISLSKMEKKNPPQILSPSSSGRRRRSTDSPSPEFEFWMVRNPSFPQPDLVSADELFVDGILRPLHHREPPDPPKSSSDTPPNEPEPESEQPGLEPGLSVAPTVSKRWTDIFKKSSVRKNNGNEEKEKEKKREKKGGGGVNGVSSAELNINIWPFFRSRSAGSGGSRPRMAVAANRKVSSAPCSRSNSAGESKSRKWPSSPSRGGVHLGRSSPVWQARRGGGSVVGRGSEALVRNDVKGLKKEVKETRRRKTTAVPSTVAGGGGAKAKVLNLNVPTCIGYRSHLNCRNDEIESSAVSVVSGGNGGTAGHSGGVGSGDGGRGNNNLFNLRGLFTKKVY